jgi:hypothetical protein
MEAYQQRVVEEKRELDIKRDKLTEFLKSPNRIKVPQDEQDRLTRQLAVMEVYSGILAERITHFK